MKEWIGKSRALWNRTAGNLGSDEVLAQLLERGEMNVWRELYAMAANDPAFRGRLKQVVQTIPIPLAHFWLAALASLGEPIDWDAHLPDYFSSAI